MSMKKYSKVVFLLLIVGFSGLSAAYLHKMSQQSDDLNTSTTALVEHHQPTYMPDVSLLKSVLKATSELLRTGTN